MHNWLALIHQLHKDVKNVKQYYLVCGIFSVQGVTQPFAIHSHVYEHKYCIYNLYAESVYITL